MAKMANNAIFSCYKINGKKKMKKSYLVDVIFVGSHSGRITMVIHGKKNEEWG